MEGIPSYAQQQPRPLDPPQRQESGSIGKYMTSDLEQPGDDSCCTRRLLVNTRVSELHGELADTRRQVVCLTDSATVSEALQVMAQHRILSAPVVSPSVCDGDEEPSPSNPDESAAPSPQWQQRPGASCDISSFVDVRSILLAFLTGLDMESVSGMNLLQRMREVQQHGQAFGSQCLSEIDFDVFDVDGDFLHVRQARASLLELIMYGLLDPKRKGLHAGESLPRVVHRVALFDSQGHITSIISQTDIVLFLYQNHLEMGGLGGRTVTELGWGSKPVVSVTPEVPAVEALLAMKRHGVSALAIVSKEHGRILGDFSVSELRTMTADNLGALALPVGEFLALGNETEFVGFNHPLDCDAAEVTEGHKFVANRLARVRSSRTLGEEVGQKLTVVSPSHTFADVLRLLVERRTHRAYVVDADEVPISIVTCTDVLRKVVDIAAPQ